MEKTTQLRHLLFKEPECLIVPGVSNALFARVVEEMGFKVIYASGAGITNLLLGLPDLGLTSMTEVLDSVRRIVDATDLPVIADIDTGYGNPLNVSRTVREFSRAGAAGLQIEDQVSPKRCGHFSGKSVIAKEEMVYKIKAALDTRLDSDLVIIARTDARATEGFMESIERANVYVEAGADMTFVEAPRTIEELAQIPKLIPCPQVANMVEDGLTPLVPVTELERMGFSIALYANLTLRAALRAIQAVLKRLMAEGSSQAFLDQMISMDERNRLTKLHEIQQFEKKYGIR